MSCFLKYYLEGFDTKQLFTPKIPEKQDAGRKWTGITLNIYWKRVLKTTFLRRWQKGPTADALLKYLISADIAAECIFLGFYTLGFDIDGLIKVNLATPRPNVRCSKPTTLRIIASLAQDMYLYVSLYCFFHIQVLILKRVHS